MQLLSANTLDDSPAPENDIGHKTQGEESDQNPYDYVSGHGWNLTLIL